MLCSDNTELIPLGAAGVKKYLNFLKNQENSRRDVKNLANKFSSKP